MSELYESPESRSSFSEHLVGNDLGSGETQTPLQNGSEGTGGVEITSDLSTTYNPREYMDYINALRAYQEALAEHNKDVQEGDPEEDLSENHPIKIDFLKKQTIWEAYNRENDPNRPGYYDMPLEEAD